MSLIGPALGRAPVDTLITNVRLANVFTGEIYPADIAIYNGMIVAVEKPGTQPAREAREVIDGRGMIATPGLIDAHLHIESTLVTMAQFARAVLPLGTTTIAEDPHEVANVSGIEGIKVMIEAARQIPLKVEFLISSSVPSLYGMETAGATIGPAEVTELLAYPEVIGLAEVMDGASVMEEAEPINGILEAAGGLYGYQPYTSRVIDGHNPMLRERRLSAFVAAGIDSDHTQAKPHELVEKARNGVCLMLQERYIDRDVIAAVQNLPLDTGFCIITDDVAPDYMLKAGHMDQVMRRCIALGMDPMLALRASTLNPARRMRLWERGLIAPGRAADIVLTESIEHFRARLTMVNGEIVAQDGECLWEAPAHDVMAGMTNTVHLSTQMPADFSVQTPVTEGEVEINVIDCVPGQTLVTLGKGRVSIREGRVQFPAGDDLAFIAVVGRHESNSGRRVIGVVRGLGITAGALATTYAHDSHNLVVIGHTPEAMARAANAAIEAGGGLAVVDDIQVLSVFPLPVCGIISDRPVAEVAEGIHRIGVGLEQIGLEHPHWLMRVSTFSLPVSSGLRISDLGLIDAHNRAFVDLFVS
ncbi:MAG: adenine deaminase [Anaerolineae bacterium]|nr:adenine deaminase [Anaerolineae bacterium]